MRILTLSIFIFLISFSFSSQQEQNVQAKATVRSEMPNTMGGSELFTPRLIDSGCKVGGCYNELCMNLATNMTITCDFPFRNEFKCYENTNCRLLADGTCDWDPKERLNDCLRTTRAGVTPLVPRLEERRCVTDGCFDEFCVDSTLPRMRLDTCDARPEFDCLRFTRCSLIGDRCDFEMNRDFRDCMDSMRMLDGREERRLRRRERMSNLVTAFEPRRFDLDFRREERRGREYFEPREFRREFEFRRLPELFPRRFPEFEHRRREDFERREFRREPELLPRRLPELEHRREHELLPREIPIRASKMVSDSGNMKKQML